MIDEQRVTAEWEWRLVASDRERRRAAQTARRRRRLRLLLSGLFLAAVVASAMLAASALSLPSPYARAALATVSGDTTGAISARASGSDNEVTSTATGAGSAATWGGGLSDASSYVQDGALISIGTVSMTDVRLLDGRITAASVELVADAGATREAVSGGIDVSRVEGLQVDGEDVSVSDLPLTIAGVGTLSALERREAVDDGALEAEVVGLRLQLSDAWKGLPEGADIVVGMAAACADRQTAARLLPKPIPEPTQTAEKPDGSGDASGGASNGGGGADSSGGASSGGSAAGGSGSSGGGSAAADSFKPGPMPAPGKVSGKLLPFPGAVFPVTGKVWYGDDFAVVRAPGIQHGACDVFARKGTPVVAVQAGVITEIRYRSLGGNSFHLTADRDYFYYAHLQRYAAGIEDGTAVEAGQLLGYVGNTGNAITTPPHLHFEIHPGGGDPIDPFPYLELWRGADTGAASPDSGSGGEAGQPPADPASATASPEEMLGRHDRAVVVAGVTTNDSPSTPGAVGLVPAALSFGVLGGLVTCAVRRRRAEVYLLNIDLDDLSRAARRGT